MLCVLHLRKSFPITTDPVQQQNAAMISKRPLLRAILSNYSSSHDQISLKCTCLGAMAGLVRCWNLQVTVECTSRDALICLRPNHSKTGNGMNFSFPADTCIYKKLAWWLFGCPIDMVVVVASQRRGPRFNPVSSHIFRPTTTMIKYLIWGIIK